MLKQTKEARVFRRAQAVRAVVAGHYVSAVSVTFRFTNSALRQWVQRFAREGVQGLYDRPRPGRPVKVTWALEQHLNRLVDQDPLQHGALFPVELSRTRDRPGPPDGRPTRPGKRALCVKKNALSYCRPTGRLDPDPAALAFGHLALAALAYRARRGEIILRYADATSLWRCAMLRAGWWRRAHRVRLPIRPLSQSQIKREEALKRQTWVRYRSWSRITSGVLLSVIGAVQYGTSRVCYKIVPHFDAQEWRQYIHPVMATFRNTEKEVVMGVDRSGLHRAHKLDATLDHYDGKFRLHFLPARCGHPLNPLEGFWRVMKDAIGAGRCFADLHLLYQRTRQVLMAPQEQPIYAFHW
jgi:transposase